MTSDEEWGPRLTAYLENYWRARGTNRNAWAGQHPGIEAPTIARWATGSVPTLSTLRAVAGALDVPIEHLLAVAGIIEPADDGTPAPPHVCTIDEALRVDPSLPDVQRRTLTDLLDAMRRIESGAARTVKNQRRKT